MISWGEEDRYCEDKKTLECCLEELLKDPTIAETFFFLLHYKKPQTTEET